MSDLVGKLMARAAAAVPRPLLVQLNRYPALRSRLKRAVDGAARAALPAGVAEVTMPAGPLAGLRLELDFDHIGERTIYLDTYEPWVQARVAELIRPGLRVWDVGAYIGTYALLFARHGGEVTALEPDPTNRARLEANLERNGLRARVLPYAVSDAPGEVSFRPDDMHSEIRHSGIGDGEVRVEAVTLEELLERFGPPDVVLMDIQGAEAAALRGAEKLLRDVRPTWVVELHGPEGLEAYELLRQAGYKLEGADHPVAAVLARQGRTHVIARP